MMPGGFDWDLVISWGPEFFKGALATIWISFFSLLLALLLGLIVSFLRMNHFAPLRFLGRAYVDAIRGTPALIQIFVIFFGLPFFGIRVPAYVAGILALGMNSGAYIAEMIRGALESVDPGMIEAARSLGMSNSQTLRRIILPQAARIALPPITGEYNTLVKGTSLLAVVSIAELTRVGQRILGATFRPVEAWVPVAIIYFLINYVINSASNNLEKRWAIEGQGTRRV
jgi:polar amino acid transport system permease protein